jgi:hypothetical protein
MWFWPCFSWQSTNQSTNQPWLPTL